MKKEMDNADATRIKFKKALRKILIGLGVAFAFVYLFGWAPALFVPGHRGMTIYSTFVTIVGLAAPVIFTLVPWYWLGEKAPSGLASGAAGISILYYLIFGQFGDISVPSFFRTLLCPAGFEESLRTIVDYNDEDVIISFIGRGQLGEISLDTPTIIFSTALFLLLFFAVFFALAIGAHVLVKKIQQRGIKATRLTLWLTHFALASVLLAGGYLFLKNQNSPGAVVFPALHRLFNPAQTDSLIAAVRRSNVAMIKKLIDSGADITARNWRGETPSGVAAEIGNPEVIALLAAELAQSRPGVESLYAKGIAFTEEAFIRVIEADDREAVTLFLKAGIRLNPADAQDSYCPVGRAVAHDRVEIAEMLFAGGARLDACDLHRGLLVTAAGENRERMVSLLLAQGAAVNGTDTEERTALLAATEAGNVRIAHLLLEAGADVHRKNNNDENAATSAAKSLRNFPLDSEDNPCIRIIRLLADGGIDLSAQDTQGWTPLMYASLYGNSTLVRYLVSKNVNVNLYLFQQNAAGMNALQMARKKGFSPIADLLIQAGARE